MCISREEEIDDEALLRDWGSDEIAQRKAESHEKRERYWLEQLRRFDKWPVLFVCGAEHVTSFRNLLEQENITVFVAATDWTSNNTVEGDARATEL